MRGRGKGWWRMGRGGNWADRGAEYASIPIQEYSSDGILGSRDWPLEHADDPPRSPRAARYCASLGIRPAAALADELLEHLETAAGGPAPDG